MIVEVIGADAGATAGIGVVTPAEDAGVRDAVGQEIAKPVDFIVGGPCPVAMAVEAMHGDDADEETLESRPAKAKGQGRASSDRRGGRRATHSTTGLRPSATVFRP